MAEILIVDDEPAIQELFKYVFEGAGHRVTVAMNGLEALACIASDIPDFIVLDVAMPGMSGKEFALELKRLSRRDARLSIIRFVVMTGENFMDSGLNRVFASTPGFVCFFSKMTPLKIVLQKAAEVLKR